MSFKLVSQGKAAPLVVEKEAFEGVRRIAGVVAEDIRLVSGVAPAVENQELLEKQQGKVSCVLCATVGKSACLDRLEQEGKFDAGQVKGKREVYQIALVEKPFDGVDEMLVICGSDKRGTIYGMFALSEYIGVTALVYFGDQQPVKQRELIIGSEIACLSKEPSVRYRGFFINDEWPCFGNWAFSHFGGVNSTMYENVFIFLLRMKGNYLWPAMWASSFPIDGPGSANEELADLYGVVMGYSHHEPCLRASEEWDKVKGEDTPYGTAWNFYTNEKGLLNYWRDSLKRSGKYENIITIGMRGERDSSMLGEQATVEENVNLLKDIIRKQRQLIRENVNPDLEQVPQMLALYKEVEAYFYGDEHVAGLKDWEELDDVICMLCEDNFGHMRTLPTEEIRNHKGGFGMYYHFDYHGGPISYEWVDSTPLSKTWEQMCNAYEYGIRQLWIVNVGDLKLHEVPLTYFMSLAYDFEKWGTSNPESYREYAMQWADSCFHAQPEAWKKRAAALLNDYLEMNHMRRPESLNENIYHPCHELEADCMLSLADRLMKENEALAEALPEEQREGYFSMIGFSVAASCNLLKMHLYAAKSTHYARQGRPAANYYGKLAMKAIAMDKELAEKLAGFKNGKWKGMELASHIGFTRWNEDGCKYPVISTLYPIGKPRMSVSRKDAERICVKNYGAPDVVWVEDFQNPGTEQVILEISNDGVGALEYQVKPQQESYPAWLQLSQRSGRIEGHPYVQGEAADPQIDELIVSVDRKAMTEENEETTILITDSDTTVAVRITAKKWSDCYEPMTFLPGQSGVVMNACHYAAKQDTASAGYSVLEGYGKYGSAVKVFPVTDSFTQQMQRPALTYRFVLPEAGEYDVCVMTAPTNPAVKNMELAVTLKANENPCQVLTLVDSTFRAGENSDAAWCRGVLDQIRKASLTMSFEAGVNTLSLGALQAGVVPERICITPKGKPVQNSYFGPGESYLVK